MLERFALGRADRVIVATQDDANYLVENHRTPRSKISILPNPIDVVKFAPANGTRNNHPQNEYLFIGRLESEKRPELAAAAVALTDSGKLTFIGEGSLLPRLLKQFGDIQRIEFIGQVNNQLIPDHLRAASGLLMTSEYEGNPKAVLEAMACGVPVIAVRAPGIIDMIVDGVTGILCGESPEAIAEGMNRLNRDNTLRDTIVAGARELVVQNHSIQSIVRAEVEILNSIERDT